MAGTSGTDKVEGQRSPVVTVRCHNNICWHNGVERQVGLLHLGQGVYANGGLVCECGVELETVTA